MNITGICRRSERVRCLPRECPKRPMKMGVGGCGAYFTTRDEVLKSKSLGNHQSDYLLSTPSSPGAGIEPRASGVTGSPTGLHADPAGICYNFTPLCYLIRQSALTCLHNSHFSFQNSSGVIRRRALGPGCLSVTGWPEAKHFLTLSFQNWTVWRSFFKVSLALKMYNSPLRQPINCPFVWICMYVFSTHMGLGA